MERGVKGPDVREVGVARTDKCPIEQLKGCLVVVEELCPVENVREDQQNTPPVLIVDAIDVNRAQCEADVDNDEDEEEDKDVHHHVAH